MQTVFQQQNQERRDICLQQVQINYQQQIHQDVLRFFLLLFTSFCFFCPKLACFFVPFPSFKIPIKSFKIPVNYIIQGNSRPLSSKFSKTINTPRHYYDIHQFFKNISQCFYSVYHRFFLVSQTSDIQRNKPFQVFV